MANMNAAFALASDDDEISSWTSAFQKCFYIGADRMDSLGLGYFKF